MTPAARGAPRRCSPHRSARTCRDTVFGVVFRVMRRLIHLCLLGVLSAGCGPAAEGPARYVTTIHPVRAILAEVCGDRAEVTALVSPGASPHTYEPRPSDLAAATKAPALFYAAHSVDAWAARLPAKERIELFSLVPPSERLPWMESLVSDEHAGEHGHAHDNEHGHDHGAYDGHFWSDPNVVRGILPALVEKLSAVDPPGAEIYRRNAARFAEELTALDAEMRAMFSGLGNRPVLLFHPSWNYFMHRYGLDVAGMIEPEPGKEATVRFIEEVVRTAKERGARAVFTEPQLPKRPAEVVARATALPLFELDPNGGVPGRMKYAELIRYNAAQLKKAIE